MNRKTLSEAMVVTSDQVNGRVNEFLEGEYVSVALDSWTDVTKVKMVNVLGVLKGQAIFFDTIAVEVATAEVLASLGVFLDPFILFVLFSPSCSQPSFRSNFPSGGPPSGGYWR